MKRWLILLAAVLALTGCAAEPEDTTPPTAAVTAPSQTPVSTEPPAEAAALYEAGSTMEVATGGTVRTYPLNRSDSVCVLPMGEDLLLLSGSETSTLTLLTGEDLSPAQTAALNCLIDPVSPALRVAETGVTYYDGTKRELVMLDAGLAETKRITLPESIIGSPALPADSKTVYYCTEDSLRSIDLESGLDRLLKEMPYPCRTLTGLYCNDTVLACAAADGNRALTLYLSAQTGETLYTLSDEVTLWTAGQDYVAVHYDGAYPELISGTAGDTPRLLDYGDSFDAAAPSDDLSHVVLASTNAGEKNGRLDCYAPESGLLTASVTIPGSDPVHCIQSDASGQYIWFLRYDSAYGCDILCRWDFSGNLIAEPTAYLGQRYDAQNPDRDGLDRCAEKAAALSEKYGVEILIWQDADAIQPEDAVLTTEYQVPLIEPALDRLDNALACYPEGFLKKTAAGTDSGILKICLVRSISGGAEGLQYWTDDSACIALCPDENLEQNLHHQLFYVLENRVLSTCTAYDSWNKLNPDGFAYNLNQISAPDEGELQWLEGENRAFIDFDSMSFPRVDRARIMEYAITSGNRGCFESEAMQSKLRKLCLGIREAFDLEDSDEFFRWEQYLSEPINK